MYLMLNLISNAKAQSMELKLCKAHLHHCYLFNEYSWALSIERWFIRLVHLPFSAICCVSEGRKKYEHIFGYVMSNSASNDYKVIKSSGCLNSGKQFV